MDIKPDRDIQARPRRARRLLARLAVTGALVAVPVAAFAAPALADTTSSVVAVDRNWQGQGDDHRDNGNRGDQWRDGNHRDGDWNQGDWNQGDWQQNGYPNPPAPQVADPFGGLSGFLNGLLPSGSG
ncbi:hypothetical protein [Antrihabitans sp. YC2-6]|uniref:hypothetical protein n=1 Tax=Antrihabitans sp. YC2-6 TaxID=2799498 RepID=UPI0018F5D9D9|nr:hypothetical protein [Antrihabitans sp. YC2-6]MBJ8348451.1 hypothetical protein [Antrihabitans sp. YC2-6]